MKVYFHQKKCMKVYSNSIIYFLLLKKGIKEFLEKWKSNFFIKKIEAWEVGLENVATAVQHREAQHRHPVQPPRAGAADRKPEKRFFFIRKNQRKD